MDDPECFSAEQQAEAHLLAVYAMPDCPGWERAQALIGLVQMAGTADLDIRLIDLSRAAAPEWVVASPTWALDGRRIALGNPDLDWLLARIAAVKGGD